MFAFHKERNDYFILPQFTASIIHEVRQSGRRVIEEFIDAEQFDAFVKERHGQVGAEKSVPAGGEKFPGYIHFKETKRGAQEDF